MTAAHPPFDPEDDAMIRRLAEMDMLAAEKAHAILMAAEEPTEVATALLAYQRAARSARQTLMLKARLQRMAVEVTPLGARQDPSSRQPVSDFATDVAVGERIVALQDAVGRVIAAAHPADEARQDALLAGHDALVDAELERPDFLRHPLDQQVVAQCEALGLPGDLADRWRALPKPRPRPVPDAELDALFDDRPGPGLRGSG